MSTAVEEIIKTGAFEFRMGKAQRGTCFETDLPSEFKPLLQQHMSVMTSQIAGNSTLY